jgi:hypothetical protein
MKRAERDAELFDVSAKRETKMPTTTGKCGPYREFFEL